MAIDIGINNLESRDQRYLDEFKARLAELNLVPMVYFGGVAASLDAEVRDAMTAQALKGLEVAVALGCKTAGFHTAQNGRVTHAGQVQFATEELKIVGREARRLGIKIAQENFNFWTSDDLIKMAEGSDPEFVGINNDTGNWLITGEDPVDATRKVLPYTYHSHVRDYVLEEGTYNGVAVGDGLVDFERLLPLLAKAGQQRTLIFSIEVDTDNRDEDEAFARSCQYVKNWLTKHGLM
jgi:sugar phosphate isomerase/epimerase